MDSFDVLTDGKPEEESMEAALNTRAFAVQADHEECDDARLVEAATRDPAAYGALYERYYARIYRYVYHRVGTAADAEDITALVFMKALEALPSYRPQRNTFAPWLFRIARNAVVDHYRRRKPQSPLDAVAQHSSDDDPARDFLGKERDEELQLLVQHLSPEQREVVLLRFAGDLSFSEIAATLKKNEPAIRMLLHRGLRKLKTVMDHE